MIIRVNNGRASHLLAMAVAIVTLAEMVTSGEQPANATNIITTTTTTTTTLAPKTDQSTTNSTSVPEVNGTATTQSTIKDRDEVKKIIIKHIDPNHGGENRLAMNRPTQAPQMVDFAPESVEAKVSEATNQFGLNFINSLSGDPKGNVVISPLSLQNLLNMVLLGSSDNSMTQEELAKVLGYDSSKILFDNPVADRLKPHEAMRSVFQSILAATHLPLVAPSSSTTSHADQTDLLNTNTASLSGHPADNQTTNPADAGKLSAALQTATRDSELPLSGQLNFTLANLVLTNKDLVELKPDYEKDLRTYYNVNIEQFSRDKNKGDASNKSEPTTAQQAKLHDRVNDWVKNMTQNQIEKLAEESDLSGEDLIMILLNAAHFKGRWLHTFNTKATHELTFFNHGSEKDATRVKFMRQKGTFGYAEFGASASQSSEGLYMGSASSADSKTRASDDSETLLTEDVTTTTSPTSTKPTEATSASNCSTCSATSAPPPTIELSKEETRRLELTSKLNCSALMLPFSLNDGQELSMVILLPTKRDGLPELQAALDSPALNEIYRSLYELPVQIELPKFSFESSHDAKATLLKMGLKSIFRDSANLDRMFASAKGNSTIPAKVDKVIHKAKINVDESGAEAAAASMASVVLRNFIRPPTPTFVADHPFLFIIRHNRSNMPLFMGRVSSL